MKTTRFSTVLILIAAGLMALPSCKKDEPTTPNVGGSGGSGGFSLNCTDASHNGSLTEGQTASGVSSEVPYSEGDGSTHNGQTVASTGVTGLTASLAAGVFADDTGVLTYTITGTPSSSGTANFALNIGGETCTIGRTVATIGMGSIAFLNCAGATNSGTLTEGQPASSVTSVVPYSAGNGGPHSGQTIASTGVTGLTATLGAGIFANGDGTLTYTITGTPAFGGTASFTLSNGGQTCSIGFNVAEAPLAIGDILQGGIVFYLDGSGGGLIAAAADQSGGTEWGCWGTELTGAGGTGIGTGIQNTIDIEIGCSESGTAADICANLVLNGYNDWFLPSIDELELMHQNLHLQGLGDFIDDNDPFQVYWSSTEQTQYQARVYSFENGGINSIYSKDLTARVRAVRAF